MRYFTGQAFIITTIVSIHADPTNNNFIIKKVTIITASYNLTTKMTGIVGEVCLCLTCFTGDWVGNCGLTASIASV